jgi:hypothetical protein
MAKTFMDAWRLHKNNRNVVEYTCTDDGDIRFLDFELIAKSHIIAIHYVCVSKQRTGIFTRFMQQIHQEEKDIKSIIICGVGSWDMIHCLQRLGTKFNMVFVDKGGDFIWHRDFSTYKN